MIAAVALLCTSVVAGAPPETPSIELRAYVSTAGPYGESWELKLGRDGRARLQVLYMLTPMGKMEGDFLVSEAALMELRSAVTSARFGELPKSIWPEAAPLHQPDLRLTITIGDARHHVSVYDPAQFAKDERVARFMTVWNKAFALVPLRPKW